MSEDRTFNRGIAMGEAFCNRIAELDRLVKNVRALTHTLLISPRRYGKTSLALRAIEQTKLPYAYVDLFMKYDIESITNEFLMSIGSLISRIIRPTETAIRKLESLLKNLSVSVRVGDFGFEFTLTPKTRDNRKSLKSLLLGVDELLAKNKKRAIIFIDEMQAISETSISDEIESSLRFIAQKTRHISFIFSGSSRHLLSRMFEDRSRPLYKLCHIMFIQRISTEHYIEFINKFAKKTWKQLFSSETLEQIFLNTQRHPYYLNILCSYLFEMNSLPSPDDANRCWDEICREEQGSIARDIEFLTPKQKHLLKEIARQPDLTEPTAKEFVNRVDLTPKGILGAIDILLKHDIIERLSTGEIRIVDPVLEYWSR